MASQRADIAMTAGEVDAFLRDGRVCVLVTLGPDGLPDPVPMWYLVDEAGALLMRTFTKSQKVVNLSRDARFAALVEDGHRYAELRGVQLTGEIQLIDDPELVAETVVGLAVKYEGLAPRDVPVARDAALARAGKQVAMRLRPTRVVSWDHAKISHGGQGAAT